MDWPARAPGEDDVPRLGSMFGHYRIDSILGRGGMGVVFRATDVRLGRAVALKVLALELADDPRFRERFERESRLAASMEHPGILPVYEADVLGSTMYIAMRLASGGDLATAIVRDGPLPLERTLGIAAQVAETLDAAHARGLVHRDVKAANILLERSGGPERAYLADFGLSRLLSGSGGRGSDTVVAGSLETIAPEQVRGSPPDGRADQYALACVVFQCLSGSPPFEGDSEAAILYAHLEGPIPSLAPSGGSADPILRAADQVMQRALAKLAVDRWPDCRSFISALTAATAPALAVSTSAVDLPLPGQRPLTEPGSRGRGSQRRGTRSPGWRVGALVVGAAMMGASALGFLAWDGRDGGAAGTPPPSGPAPSRLPDDATASGATLDPDQGTPVAITPSALPRVTDPPGPPLPPQELPGVIVFAAHTDATDGFDLYRIDPDGLGQLPITGDPGDEVQPAASSDGRYLAYSAGELGTRALFRLRLDGGDVEPLLEASGSLTDPAWAPDGSALAYSWDRDGQRDIAVVALDAAGRPSGEPRLLAASAADERRPSWSPAGDHLAYVAEQAGVTTIRIIRSVDGGLVAELAAGGVVDDSPEWTPSGDLVFTGRHGNDLDVFLMRDPLGTPSVEPLTLSSHDDWGASPSLDGSALVYQSGKRLGEDTLGALFLLPTQGGPPIPLTLDRAADVRDPTWVPEGWQLDH